MGKYHPHGELAIYDAMVRMAQDFSMRLPLIDGQGNFGSMDGDPPAADRYTEARLARVADSLLDDLDKDTVDFQPNYDETEREPKVLPAGFPNLLVNGAQGIAVGMATNIPPHNLGEVIDACCAYLDNRAITIEELMEYVPAPDFPTGGIIIGRAGTHAAYQDRPRRGRAARARAMSRRSARTATRSSSPRCRTRSTSRSWSERIAESVREKLVEGIADLRDESDRDGVRLVIELKRDADPDIVLNQLYRHTALQTSFGVNMLALNGGRPELMTLRDIIVAFIAFREEVITRRTTVSAQQGARAGAHPGRPADRGRQHRRDHRADPRRARPGGGPRRADRAALAGRRCRAADRRWSARTARCTRTAPTSCPTSRRARSSICACSA